MDIRWYGQSAFLLTGEKSVFVDPFGDPASVASHGLEFRYPPIEGVRADLVLVTHEHFDHNAVDGISGEPTVLRAPGTHESPIGEVVGIASEHDSVAGTQRGPNTIFRFTFDGLSVAHFGDFGQTALRPERRSALGSLDVLFLPVGGGPTIGGAEAAAVVRELRPWLGFPMHYRTAAVNFLEPADDFLAALGAPVTRLATSEANAEGLLGTSGEPTIALLAPPLPRA
jgi:L-ascorbate metabolism protein UlaG (beta-lactamase superfamily)